MSTPNITDPDWVAANYSVTEPVLYGRWTDTPGVWRCGCVVHPSNPDGDRFGGYVSACGKCHHQQPPAGYAHPEPEGTVEPTRAGLPTSLDVWDSTQPHPAEGSRPSADDISNVLSALKPADDWRTSALPDGGRNAQIECEWDGSARVVMVWDDGAWIGASAGIHYYADPCTDHGIITRWRWVTKPAEAVPSNCYTCVYNEPTGAGNICAVTAFADWFRAVGSVALDEFGMPPRCATGCPGYGAKPAPTGLSREGVARKQRDSITARRPELVDEVRELRHSVEMCRVETREVMGQRDEARKAAESLAADLAEMRKAHASTRRTLTWERNVVIRERDEALAELADVRAMLDVEKRQHAETTDVLAGTEDSSARWQRKYERKRGDHAQALGELKLEREAHAETKAMRTDAIVRAGERARLEFNALAEEHAGTVEANEYLMGIITTIANESGLPDGEAEDALPEWLRDGRAEVHAFLLNIARGGRLDDEIDLLYTLERGPDALADAARKEGGG